MRHRLVLLVVALVALAAAAAVTGPAGAQKGPIRIGLLVPRTGPLSANGTDMVNGLELYLDEIGRQAAGRPI